MRTHTPSGLAQLFWLVRRGCAGVQPVCGGCSRAGPAVATAGRDGTSSIGCLPPRRRCSRPARSSRYRRAAGARTRRRRPAGEVDAEALEEATWTTRLGRVTSLSNARMTLPALQRDACQSPGDRSRRRRSGRASSTRRAGHAAYPAVPRRPPSGALGDHSGTDRSPSWSRIRGGMSSTMRELARVSYLTVLPALVTRGWSARS